MRTDSEIYGLFLSGDTSAYNELMVRYGDALTYFLNGYLHNLADAEDLMVEAFARICVKRPKIAEGCFKAYLYKTARNLATRFHFGKARAEVFSTDDLEVEPADPNTAETALLDEERRRVLHTCLQRVKPQVREALWLVYVDRLSYEDAATVMKVNRKRIDHLLQRGKATLRAELEKEDITTPWDM